MYLSIYLSIPSVPLHSVCEGPKSPTAQIHGLTVWYVLLCQTPIGRYQVFVIFNNSRRAVRYIILFRPASTTRPRTWRGRKMKLLYAAAWRNIVIKAVLLPPCRTHSSRMFTLAWCLQLTLVGRRRRARHVPWVAAVEGLISTSSKLGRQSSTFACLQ